MLSGSQGRLRLPPKAASAEGAAPAMGQAREAHHTARLLHSPRGPLARGGWPPPLRHMVGDHKRRGTGPSTGVQVTQSLGPEAPGARLGRRSHRWLGSCQGRLQVGSDLGHDLLGAADPRLPAALAAGVTLAALGSGRGPDGDLVPGDLLVDRDGHGHLRSVGDGRTYPLGKPVTKLPAWVGEVVRRGRLDHGTARAG
jgi:hypothetical protein